MESSSDSHCVSGLPLGPSCAALSSSPAISRSPITKTIESRAAKKKKKKKSPDELVAA